MADSARELVPLQIRRVRRRLFVQIAAQSILLCWAVGFLLAMAWFLARPFTFVGMGEAVRWSVPAALVGVSTLAGLALAWARRPSSVNAALALDERFALKERVTTFLTLPDHEIDTPAGQALMSDVSLRLAQLQISSAFPLRVRWQRLLLPAGAFALALAACLVDPILGDLRFTPRTSAEEPRVINVKDIKEEFDKIKKAVQERNQDQQAKSEELREFEKELEKLVSQPLDGKNEERIREQIEQMQNLQDKMKERLDALKERAEKFDALRSQLEKLNLDKDKLIKEGAARDFADALRKGDLEKAKAALEKLVKNLKNEKLTPEQRKELAEQFKQLQEKLKDIVKNDDRMKQLQKDFKDGKITKEQMDRAMERFQDLKKLTDAAGDFQDALENFGKKDGNEKLDKLQKFFEEIELTENEIRDLLRDQEEIANAMELLRRGIGADEFDPDADGMNRGPFPGGRRPIAANDPDAKIRNERSRAQADPKGIQRITGYARGGNFTKIPAKAVEGAFKQAVQNAPEAIDRQRIPDDYRDTARGYFERLGNQK